MEIQSQRSFGPTAVDTALPHRGNQTIVNVRCLRLEIEACGTTGCKAGGKISEELLVLEKLAWFCLAWFALGCSKERTWNIQKVTRSDSWASCNEPFAGE